MNDERKSRPSKENSGVASRQKVDDKKSEISRPYEKRSKKGSTQTAVLAAESFKFEKTINTIRDANGFVALDRSRGSLFS